MRRPFRPVGGLPCGLGRGGSGLVGLGGVLLGGGRDTGGIRDQLGDLRRVGGAEEVLALGLVLPDLDELVQQIIGALQGDPGGRFDVGAAAVDQLGCADPFVLGACLVLPGGEELPQFLWVVGVQCGPAGLLHHRSAGVDDLGDVHPEVLRPGLVLPGGKERRDLIVAALERFLGGAAHRGQELSCARVCTR